MYHALLIVIGFIISFSHEHEFLVYLNQSNSDEILSLSFQNIQHRVLTIQEIKSKIYDTYNIPQYRQQLFNDDQELSNDFNVFDISHKDDKIELLFHVVSRITFMISSNLYQQKVSRIFSYDDSIDNIKNSLIAGYIPNHIMQNVYSFYYIYSRLRLWFILKREGKIQLISFEPDTSKAVYSKTIEEIYCSKDAEYCINEMDIEIRIMFEISIAFFVYRVVDDASLDMKVLKLDVFAHEVISLELIRNHVWERLGSNSNYFRLFVLRKYFCKDEFILDRNSFEEVFLDLNEQRMWKDLLNIFEDLIFIVVSKDDIETETILQNKNIQKALSDLSVRVRNDYYRMKANVQRHY